MKTWENCAPSEGEKRTAAGETRTQGALEDVATPHTFGRWDVNTGILHTFGRWECHGGRRNTDTERSRSSHYYGINRLILSCPVLSALPVLPALSSSSHLVPFFPPRSVFPALFRFSYLVQFFSPCPVLPALSMRPCLHLMAET